MLKIVAACGNGMGTSMIIKIKLEKILRELKVDAKVEAMSTGQAKSLINEADIIICSSYLVDQFAKGKAKMVPVVNLMDDKEIKEAISKAL